MAALDTNVLLRYLVRDDSAQFSVASRLIQKCVANGESLFVPVSVAVELEWVLRSAYGFAKEDVMRTFSELLSTVELTFQDERAIEVALALFRDHAADFADCVHVALASQAGEAPLWTFDRQASKVPGAKPLTSHS